MLVMKLGTNAIQKNQFPPGTVLLEIVLDKGAGSIRHKERKNCRGC